MGWAIPVPVPKVQKSFPLTPDANDDSGQSLLKWWQKVSQLDRSLPGSGGISSVNMNMMIWMINIIARYTRVLLQ